MASRAHEGTVYRIGEILYEPGEARLSRNGEEITLQPKVHEALLFFVEHPLRLFDKTELLAELWPDAHVTDDVLSQIIWKLRRALGDDPKTPRFLQTVLKRGYRFLVEPTVVSSVTPPPQPPRAAFDPHWYIHRKEDERAAQGHLSYAGAPVVVLAPARFGKTWFLRHLLHAARYDEKVRTVILSLDALPQRSYGDLGLFLLQLALHLCNSLGVPPEMAEKAFARSTSPQANLTWLLSHTLLPPLMASGERLYLALDRADALGGQPIQDEFFGLLRAFAEAGSDDDAFACLRLLLAVSTTKLVSNPRQSPFNLTDPIRLHDLDRGQVQILAGLHGVTLDQAEEKSLRELVGGHPYLVRVVLHAAAERGRSVASLLSSCRWDGIFDEVLTDFQSQLAANSGLASALRTIARGEVRDTKMPRQEDLYNLQRAGYIIKENTSERISYRLRYRLYEELCKP